MTVKVVDASALGALLFAEPEDEAILNQIDGHFLAAPALLGFEIANICVKKLRRHPTQRDDIHHALAMFAKLSIEIVSVDFAETFELSDRSGLTAYDASYLLLAQTLGAELVTLDRQLQAAYAKSSTPHQ